jgi:transcriptional activator SPT7
MHLAYQAQHNLGAAGAAGANGGLVFPLPEPYAPLTKERIEGEIGLVRDFFRARLARTTGTASGAAAAAAAAERAAAAAAAAAAASNGDPAAAPAAPTAPTGPALIEDEDLPQKQRFPKPRLPPTGKISSPRKRPLREQQQAAKKKRKLEEEGRVALLNGGGGGAPGGAGGTGGRVDVTKTVGTLKLLPPNANAKERGGGEKGEGKEGKGDRSLMMDSSLGNKSKRDTAGGGGGGNAEDAMGEKEGDVNGPMSPESISG